MRRSEEVVCAMVVVPKQVVRAMVKVSLFIV